MIYIQLDTLTLCEWDNSPISLQISISKIEESDTADLHLYGQMKKEKRH